MAINNTQDLETATAPDLEAYFTQILTSFGLQELVPVATKLATEGASEAEFMNAIEATDAYRRRFPAIFARREKGLPPITATDILNYEHRAGELETLYGLPEGFLTSKAQDFMVQDVSFDQLRAQVAFASDVLTKADPETLFELQRFYGLEPTSGALLAYVIDPERALPHIQEQVRIAEIAASTTRGGFQLTKEEAAALEAQGVSPDDARARAESLTTLGEVITGTNILDAVDRETRLKVLAGDTRAIGELRKRAERLASPFQGGGAFATDRTGITGIGVAT